MDSWTESVPEPGVGEHPPEELGGLAFHYSQPDARVPQAAREGFGTHWDDHNVIVVQVEGSKHWRLYGPTRSAPMHRDTAQPEPPPSSR